MVKAHPAYSGTIMTATFQIVREFGWQYLEKLAKQKVMQVQSSTDPPKKLALGEHAVMADGNDYNLIQLKEAGQPVEVVYPVERTPLVTGPSAVFKSAPNPNAARLFQNWLHSLEAQQLLVDFARQHSVHPLTKEKPGARRLERSSCGRTIPPGSSARARRSRRATRRSSRCKALRCSNYRRAHDRLSCTVAELRGAPPPQAGRGSAPRLGLPE